MKKFFKKPLIFGILLATFLGALRAQEGESASVEAPKPEEADAVQSRLDEVKAELERMTQRDAENRRRLEQLEANLVSAKERADREAGKFEATAAQLKTWETRAAHAAATLDQTNAALKTSLEAATAIKALSAQYKEQLESNVGLLVASEAETRRQGDTIHSLEAELTASRAQVERLRQDASKAAETAGLLEEQLGRMRNDYEALIQTKLVMEKELTHSKSKLAAAQEAAEQVPALQTRISEMKEASDLKAHALQDAEANLERLAVESEKRQDLLDATLTEREKLNDALSLLRVDYIRHKEGGPTSIVTPNHAAVSNLHGSLRAKEKALQDAYAREKEALTKLDTAASRLEEETKARQALYRRFAGLRADLRRARDPQ